MVYKIDMFASCKQVKRNVFMRQKQRIFHMVEYNLKRKFQAQLGFLKVIYNLQPLQYLLVTEKISWAYYSYAICKMASLDFSWRRTLGSETIFGNWKPFKNDEKYFLFHLESFFRSQDFWIFVLNFWSCSKAAWLERSG